jgi:murein DD-endopeptidase MepM/ murein hydrolase activator NlpD
VKVARFLCILGFWLAVVPSAWADNATPQVSPAPPVVTEPTAPPVVDAAPPTAVPPVIDSSPVAPAKEYNQPTASAPESGLPSTAVTTVAPRYETGPTAPGVTLNPNSPSGARVPSAPTQSGTDSVSGTLQISSASPPADISSITSPYVSVSAQAPAQLTCRGKHHGNSLPFLVSPFAGWTELVSFLDHDSPDYTVDGSIVLANGITATAGDGQESDLFPAYWSPTLRQFVNYDGHNGYDFGLSYQPVLAAGTGTVTFAGWNSSDTYAGYGQMVLIDHHNGYVTLYGHLSNIEVQQGDKVTAGQEIGISGTTGHSSGPHLHFSVFHNCQVTDPYGWTGHGTDPLFGFDGEHASYLWLPGHDPLVVNPPRDWPAFPLGLHLSVSAAGLEQSLARHARASKTPPIDRLLLLDLPESQSVGISSPAVALARTEASITQEAEALAPALDDLKSQGLIDTFQVIPAAAAVWLRGTASATQLLSLPGVASLAGVQPHDLSAAQVGLSHDVLIQIRQQQAPSLWPLGFRSALHAWRPMMTVVNRHALVTGLALPGQHVTLSLRRKGEIAGVAEATADVDSGGFVAMLHDVVGNPVATGPGDVVSVNCGGKTDKVTLVPLDIKARSYGVSGEAPAGASVPVTLTRVGGSVSGESVVTTPASSVFDLPTSRLTDRGALAAGELAVGTVADAGGDQEAASAFVPGAQIYEGSALVRGWTVGSSPRLVLIRGRKTILTKKIRSASDGTFQLELHRGGRLVPLLQGDILRLGSRWHPRAITLPALHVNLESGTRSVRFSGPTNAHVVLTVTRSNGLSIVQALRMDAQGRGTVALPDGPLSLGDMASLKFVSSTGDQIYARGQTRGILIREGFATVSGTVRAGAVLSIHALSTNGSALGGAVVTADRETGSFSAELRTKAGQAMRLRAGIQLLVRDGSLATTTTLPALELSRSGKVIVTNAVALAHQSAIWTGVDTRGKSSVRQLRANSRGFVADRYTLPTTSPRLDRIDVSMSAGDGVTVERVLALTKHVTAKALSASRNKTRSCSVSQFAQDSKSGHKVGSCRRTGRSVGR